MSAGEEDTVGSLSSGFSSMTVHWKINEFFSLPEEMDYMIKSPSFDSFGHECYLTLYPNGDHKGHYPTYIGLYLNRSYADPQVPKMKFELSILNEDGTEMLPSRDFVTNYWNSSDGLSSDKYISKTQLVWQKKQFGPKGIIIICCHLNVPTFGIKEMALTKIVHEGMDNLAKNFKELYLSGEQSEITLTVRGREFKCHRAVLAAQSPVFAAMLRQDMRERTTGLVQIEDCEPETFQQFLIYLYSGNVNEFTEENTSALYVIADKYDVSELKARCVHNLILCLRVENFGDIVDMSLLHGESDLLMPAFSFFAKNTKAILVTTSWQNFLKKNPIAANDFYLKALDMNNSQM